MPLMRTLFYVPWIGKNSASTNSSSVSLPVFQCKFGLPQPTESNSQLPSIDIPESSDILQPFIQYLYPCSPPDVPDLIVWAALYTLADKYDAEVVIDPLRDMLVPRFLETSPMHVYALASHWGLEEDARTASRRTLAIDISEGFSEENARLVGGVACQKLYLLHIQRKDKAQALVKKCRYHYPNLRTCSCLSMDFDAVNQVLGQNLATRPWLTAEELYKEAAKTRNSRACSAICRNSSNAIHTWFSSILKDVSELPQTI